MCNYEQLLHDADMVGLTVIEKEFESNAKGLCNGKKLGLKKDMSSSKKACVLAEEIGHFHTTVGDITDQRDASNRKQEIIARKWAVDKMISIEDIFQSAEQSCSTLYEIAESLEVTEEFFLEALDLFKKRYRHSYSHKGKTIVFCDHGFCIK